MIRELFTWLIRLQHSIFSCVAILKLAARTMSFSQENEVEDALLDVSSDDDDSDYTNEVGKDDDEDEEIDNEDEQIQTETQPTKTSLATNNLSVFQRVVQVCGEKFLSKDLKAHVIKATKTTAINEISHLVDSDSEVTAVQIFENGENLLANQTLRVALKHMMAIVSQIVDLHILFNVEMIFLPNIAGNEIGITSYFQQIIAYYTHDDLRNIDPEVNDWTFLQTAFRAIPNLFENNNFLNPETENAVSFYWSHFPLSIEQTDFFSKSKGKRNESMVFLSLIRILGSILSIACMDVTNEKTKVKEEIGPFLLKMKSANADYFMYFALFIFGCNSDSSITELHVFQQSIKNQRSFVNTITQLNKKTYINDDIGSSIQYLCIETFYLFSLMSFLLNFEALTEAHAAMKPQNDAAKITLSVFPKVLFSEFFKPDGDSYLIASKDQCATTLQLFLTNIGHGAIIRYLCNEQYKEIREYKKDTPRKKKSKSVVGKGKSKMGKGQAKVDTTVDESVSHTDFLALQAKVDTIVDKSVPLNDFRALEDQVGMIFTTQDKMRNVQKKLCKSMTNVLTQCEFFHDYLFLDKNPIQKMLKKTLKGNEYEENRNLISEITQRFIEIRKSVADSEFDNLSLQSRNRPGSTTGQEKNVSIPVLKKYPSDSSTLSINKKPKAKETPFIADKVEMLEQAKPKKIDTTNPRFKLLRKPTIVQKPPSALVPNPADRLVTSLNSEQTSKKRKDAPEMEKDLTSQERKKSKVSGSSGLEGEKPKSMKANQISKSTKTKGSGFSGFESASPSEAKKPKSTEKNVISQFKNISTSASIAEKPKSKTTDSSGLESEKPKFAFEASASGTKARKSKSSEKKSSSISKNISSSISRTRKVKSKVTSEFLQSPSDSEPEYPVSNK